MMYGQNLGRMGTFLPSLYIRLRIDKLHDHDD